MSIFLSLLTLTFCSVGITGDEILTSRALVPLEVPYSPVAVLPHSFCNDILTKKSVRERLREAYHRRFGKEYRWSDKRSELIHRALNEKIDSRMYKFLHVRWMILDQLKIAHPWSVVSVQSEQIRHLQEERMRLSNSLNRDEFLTRHLFELEDYHGMDQERVEVMQPNLARAQENWWVLERLLASKGLTIPKGKSFDLLVSMNKILLEGVIEPKIYRSYYRPVGPVSISLSEGGALRTSQAYSVSESPYLAVKDLGLAIQEFNEWFSLHQHTMHPIELAGRAYERIISYHPFRNGNGRTARAFVDYILVKNGYPPMTFEKVEDLYDAGVILSEFEPYKIENPKRSAFTAVELVTLGIERTMGFLQGSIKP